MLSVSGISRMGHPEPSCRKNAEAHHSYGSPKPKTFGLSAERKQVSLRLERLYADFLDLGCCNAPCGAHGPRW